MRKGLFLITFALLSFATSAPGATDVKELEACLGPALYVPIFSAKGREILGDFSVEKVTSISRPQEDDESTVFRVHTSDGHDYAVRFEAKKNSLRFESFASALVRGFEGVISPEVHPLGEADSAALLARVAQDHPEVAARLKAGAGGKPPLASLSPFYPGSAGFAVLEDLEAGGPLRWALFEFAHTPEARGVKNDLWAAWNAASQDVRRNVIRDIRSLVPGLDRVRDENVLSFLMEYPDSLPLLKLGGLADLAVDRLPSTLRTQLADVWALNTVLGMPDSHSGNWIYLNGKVCAIDFAYQSPDFNSGIASLKLDEAHDPIDYKWAPNRSTMLASISPALRGYLTSLTPEKIRALAAANGFPLTDVALNGIMARVKLVLNGTLR